MPAFFAFTGMRTQIGLLAGGYEWLVCGLIIVVADGSESSAARWSPRGSTGSTARHSMALGVLMNTRGLMEVIVLNVGLDLGVISPTLFTMLVLMALVTTVMTVAAAARSCCRPHPGGRRRRWRADPFALRRQAAGNTHGPEVDEKLNDGLVANAIRMLPAPPMPARPAARTMSRSLRSRWDCHRDPRSR